MDDPDRRQATLVTGRKAVRVDDFMRDLDHPQKTEIEAIRRIIPGVDAGIGEGIKWNAPSFHSDVRAKRSALADIVRQWIRLM